MSAKFKTKECVTSGEVTLDVGFKAGQIAIRWAAPNGLIMHLSESQANDLADALDTSLDMIESDPLLWS